MNLLTDLGLISAAHDLERRIDEGSLATPVHLPDGTSLFVWRGRAERVSLLTWMPAFPAVPVFRRLAGSDIWVLPIPLPAKAMIEYRLGIDRGDRENAVLDPLNPETTSNPFGVNSLATGPAYQRPDWTHPNPDVAAGKVSEIRVKSDVWGERRHHMLYLPAGHTRHEPHPFVVVHDGPDFLHHSMLSVVLDNLIAQGEIPPVVAALHQPRHRLFEYASDERHAAHVEEVERHLLRRTVLDEHRVMIGSSLGAVASLSVAWHRPDSITGVGLLSGSFATHVADDESAELFGPISELVAGIDRDRRLAAMRAYISCGRYEGLIDLNRALVPRLRALDMRVRYEETWEGHQWASWRDRLRAALTHTLG